jgi:hypothetical protein
MNARLDQDTPVRPPSQNGPVQHQDNDAVSMSVSRETLKMFAIALACSLVGCAGAVALSSTVFSHTGPRGARGYVGRTGATGARGPRGLQGQQGEHGERGEQGREGQKGEKGAPGETLPSPFFRNSEGYVEGPGCSNAPTVSLPVCVVP